MNNPMGARPNDNLAHFLERWAWYRDLPADLRSLTLETATEQHAQPGDYIAREGMPSTHWYGLLTGYLHMYVVGSDSAETTLYCLREGEWGGDGSLLKKEMRRYGLRALTAAHICCIPVQTFDTLRHASIPFNHYLTEIMNALPKVQDRLLHLIETEGSQGRCTLDCTLKQLAQQLAVSHEALYRALAGLARAQRIERVGGKIVLRRARPRRPLPRCRLVGAANPNQ